MVKIKIGIDARAISGTIGGVEQSIIGLAHGLSSLESSHEEYLFFAYKNEDDWLSPYISDPCKIIHVPQIRTKLRNKFLGFTPFRLLWHYVITPIFGSRTILIPKHGEFFENQDLDLIHFPIQQFAFITDIPNIYQPYDLQHLHLPEMFSPRQFLKREVLYRTFCNQADIVVAHSESGKQDLESYYQLPSDKIVIIPLAGMIEAYSNPSQENKYITQKKYSLPNEFLFYPAFTWPHKNHIGLLKAIKIIQKMYNLVIPVVFTGGQNKYSAIIQKTILQLDLSDQIQILGYVSSEELSCIYALSKAIVFPSFFEGWGLPALEAFCAGVPLACSNNSSLPSIVGDAAFLFDPHSTIEITEAILELWTNESLRKTLIEKGFDQIKKYSWQKTAQTFRAYYRKLLNVPLEEEDELLIGLH